MNLSMIKQALELKSKLEAQSGNGAVKVTASGQQKILSIKISADVIDPDNPKQLEKLVFKAVTDALDEAKKLANKHLGNLTGGLKIPGITD